MACSRTSSLTTALMTAVAAAALVAPVAEARADATVTAARVLAGGAATQGAAWLPAAARRLSGRAPTVLCAAGAQEWARRLTRAGFAGAPDEYYGFSLVRRGEMHLSPYVCAGLRLGASAPTRRSHELQVAWSVNVLIHESEHLARFSMDEKVAEACARIALPGELHRLYGVEYHSAQMRRLTAAAAWMRRTMPPAYQRGTCPTRGG